MIFESTEYLVEKMDCPLVNDIINRLESRAFWWKRFLSRSFLHSENTQSFKDASFDSWHGERIPCFKRVCHWSTGTQLRDAIPMYMYILVYVYVCICVWCTRDNDTLNLREINILPAIPMASLMAEAFSPTTCSTETFALDHPKRYRGWIQA